ncbi:hypothetical protein K7X08_027518 [Anisodus acutangulus]|uniref:Uncharacterized protein n=1 Tax=Anisodus acutangulus TaxID=402998 RepID=A0A9Q1RIB2_9SOLA|nr:hypothetical protein K7X08_027518 [Anisodus acutangulus]
MEQCTTIVSASFNETEIEVSNILLNLSSLIEESESRSRVSPVTWSCKRKRSDRNLGFNSACSSEESDNVEVEDKIIELKSSEAISPDTPLSFSPTKFDDKDKYPSKKSSKGKTREELLNTIEKLTKCRELLRGEVENVRSYYNSQKAYNLELKAMKERVITNLNGQGQGSETCHRSQYPMGQFPQAQPMFSSANGLGSMNHTGPVGIPDLSVTLVDIAERKAQCAEARRKRMKRMEIKRSSKFNKTSKEIAN